MGVFKDYSGYYDLLYRDKDYKAEAEYVISLIKKQNPGARSLLNLGCGTGRHDHFFSLNNFLVAGVDMSEEMIGIAKKNQSENLEFHVGDARSVRLNKKFDSVVSLFHVTSYQTADEDLRAFFSTAAAHLEPGGLFVFDLWHGPAVLKDPPYSRKREIENDQLRINRTSVPEHFPDKRLIKVNFDVQITNKRTGTSEKIEEVHSMRYFFPEEIKGFLEASNLSLVHSEEWMTRKPANEASWYVIYIAKRGE